MEDSIDALGFTAREREIATVQHLSNRNSKWETYSNYNNPEEQNKPTEAVYLATIAQTKTIQTLCLQCGWFLCDRWLTQIFQSLTSLVWCAIISII